MERKVIVLGRKNMVNRVSSAIRSSAISITAYTEVSPASNLLNKGEFDVVVVDAGMENLESICYHLSCRYELPVILMVDYQSADWHILKTLDVIGFIPGNAGDAEMLTYFNSITRRLNGHRSHSIDLINKDDEHIKEALRQAFLLS
jgi:hypothetical protein